jgi:integrase/recombinase XerD
MSEIATLPCAPVQGTNLIATELNWREAMEGLRGAYADTTIDSYSKDFRLFHAWCIERGHTPLPAAPATLALYLTELIERLAAITLIRRVSGVIRVHRVLDLPNPADAEVVRLALRRIKRFRPTRPKQALGIDRKMRQVLLNSCADDVAGKRNGALVALGFEGLCRRSEVSALDVEDLIENDEGKVGILIRRGKADQDGLGRIVTLSPNTVDIVGEWVQAADLKSGPLFRPVYRGKAVPRRLTGFSISRLLKQIARSAGLAEGVVSEISGHSLRVGAAQTLLGDGHDVLRLMKVGGWRSATTVFRYIERAEISVWT